MVTTVSGGDDLQPTPQSNTLGQYHLLLLHGCDPDEFVRGEFTDHCACGWRPGLSFVFSDGGRVLLKI